jgi:hypothetical protein
MDDLRHGLTGDEDPQQFRHGLRGDERAAEEGDRKDQGLMLT